MQCTARVVSALEKVFPDEQPTGAPPTLTLLLEDVASFQIACHLDNPDHRSPYMRIELQSPLAQWITVREVKLSPSGMPCHPNRLDDGYLRTTPSLFPDRLARLPEGTRFHMVPGQWRALWIDIETDASTPAGTHPITIIAYGDDGEVFRAAQDVTVLPRVLEPTGIYHTEWLHADCIADYYGLSTEDDSFFDHVRPFIETAVRRGINTILTPLFTPPLDTYEGGERTTMQLVRVRREGDAYTFDFDRLDKWIALCEACGVRYFELSHLFSQWGAKYAPKVMGTDEQGYRRLFGWDTPGTGAAYAGFLDSFLPALRARLEALGIQSRCLLHVSDEPSEQHLEAYQKAKAIVARNMPGYKIVDALSHYPLYTSGAVDTPIVANNAIEPFLEAGVEDLWTYYCTSQAQRVSNRFFALPSARCRIIGVQMYLYNIKGFLHWGYNFYNSQFSLEQIDPYAVTDAGDAFPSGDPFLVYPGKDGRPEESIRLMQMDQAFRDLRALRQLERLTSRESVEAMVLDGADGPITFSRFPADPAYLMALRNRVNEAILAHSPS